MRDYYGFDVISLNPNGDSERGLYVYASPVRTSEEVVQFGFDNIAFKRLSPGGVYVISVPLSMIGKDTTLEKSPTTLLNNGCKLFIKYNMVVSTHHRWTPGLLLQFPDVWVGLAQSGLVGRSD
jgi:hypothetical protein